MDCVILCMTVAIRKCIFQITYYIFNILAMGKCGPAIKYIIATAKWTTAAASKDSVIGKLNSNEEGHSCTLPLESLSETPPYESAERSRRGGEHKTRNEGTRPLVNTCHAVAEFWIKKTSDLNEKSQLINRMNFLLKPKVFRSKPQHTTTTNIVINRFIIHCENETRLKINTD